MVRSGWIIKSNLEGPRLTQDGLDLFVHYYIWING